MLGYKIFTNKKTFLDKEIRRNRILRSELDYNLSVLRDTLAKLSREKVKVPLEISLLIRELPRELSKLNSPDSSIMSEFLTKNDNIDELLKQLDTLINTMNEENKVILMLNRKINNLMFVLSNLS